MNCGDGTRGAEKFKIILDTHEEEEGIRGKHQKVLLTRNDQGREPKKEITREGNPEDSSQKIPGQLITHDSSQKILNSAGK